MSLFSCIPIFVFIVSFVSVYIVHATDVVPYKCSQFLVVITTWHRFLLLCPPSDLRRWPQHLLPLFCSLQKEHSTNGRHSDLFVTMPLSLRRAKQQRHRRRLRSASVTQHHLLMSPPTQRRRRRRPRRGRRNPPIPPTTKETRVMMRLYLRMKHLKTWMRTRGHSVCLLPLLSLVVLILVTEKAMASWTSPVYTHYHSPPSIKIEDGMVKYVFTCKR